MFYLISTFNNIYYNEFHKSYIYNNDKINLDDQTVINQIKNKSTVEFFNERETAERYAKAKTQIFKKNKDSWTSLSFVVAVNVAEIELDEIGKKIESIFFWQCFVYKEFRFNRSFRC